MCVRLRVLPLLIFLMAAFPGAGLCTGSTLPRAFPGAEGFGANATGGRGGRVIEVTNLDDSGPGSLRTAIQAVGPRTVVFRISGTIVLSSRLTISHGNITIAGQTAPGDGICLRDYTLVVDTSNVIIRYIRTRLGDVMRQPEDAFSGRGTIAGGIHGNIIIDHCSASWSLDECASFYDLRDFTMQWCFITESLYHSYHPSGNHGYGGMWGGWRASFHHNLLAHHSSRNPRFNGSRYTGLPDSELVDFRNNVIYNWGFNSAYGGERGNQNVVANYYKYGPATNVPVRGRILEPSDTLGKWYVADNYVSGYPAITADNWNGGVQGQYAEIQKNRRRLTPFPSGEVTSYTAEEAFPLVLWYGGANFPRRDTLDARIANEVLTGTATFGGVWGPGKGIIDTQDSVGGWPALNSIPPPQDSDHDGMPDQWEIDHGLNPLDPNDGPLITADGYSNLEHYLNSLVPSGPAHVEQHSSRPNEFVLMGNYPNPFNPNTIILYSLPHRGRVVIRIANILGELVCTLSESEEERGLHTAVWSGADDRQRPVSSGVYMCEVHFDGTLRIHKMLLVR